MSTVLPSQLVPETWHLSLYLESLYAKPSYLDPNRKYTAEYFHDELFHFGNKLPYLSDEANKYLSSSAQALISLPYILNKTISDQFFQNTERLPLSPSLANQEPTWVESSTSYSWDTYHKNARLIQITEEIRSYKLTQNIQEFKTALKCVFVGFFLGVIKKGAAPIVDYLQNQKQTIFLEQVKERLQACNPDFFNTWGIIAFTILDPQVGFMPKNSALPGSGEFNILMADEIIPVIDDILKVRHPDIFVQISLNNYPENHSSFASTSNNCFQGESIQINGTAQILLPKHCVRNTLGSACHPDILNTLSEIEKPLVHFVEKGISPSIPSDSIYGSHVINPLTDKCLSQTEASIWEKYFHINTQFIIGGIGADFCVKSSAIGALQNNLNVLLLVEGTKGCEEDFQEKDLELLDGSTPTQKLTKNQAALYSSPACAIYNALVNKNIALQTENGPRSLLRCKLLWDRQAIIDFIPNGYCLKLPHNP